MRTLKEINERIENLRDMEDCCCKTCAIHNLKWVKLEVENWDK